MKLANWIMAVALTASSFDVFLIFQLGGTLRLSQLLLLPLMVLAVARVLERRRVLWPVGGFALALWCIGQGLLMAESPAPSYSQSLFVLICYTMLGMLATLQLYGCSLWLPWLMRMYVLSFVLVAAFSAFQFVAPALHLGQPFIVQWIVHGLIPRINGFSYEPSYFSAYLVIGWVTLVELRSNGAALTADRRWLWAAWLMTLVLLFSTSRSAWVVMIAEGLARLAVPVWRAGRDELSRLRAGSLVVPLPKARWFVYGGLVVVFFAVVITGLSRIVDLNIFLAGTGINNTVAHSVIDRQVAAHDTIQIIHDHFWIGRSMGGVAATRGQLHGLTITRVEDLRLWWGFPVILDVFAGSGLFVFLPFAYFLWRISLGELPLLRAHRGEERAKWMQALIRAFFAEWLALMADQNLMRAYLWFHITMMIVVGYNLRYAAGVREPAESLVAA